MAEEWTIELVEPWTFLNARGNPVEGYRVTFRTVWGDVSYVDISRQEFEAEQVGERIATEVEKIKAVRGL